VELETTPAGESGGTCDCCGNTSKIIWGYVGTPQQTLAAYYVHWTVGSPNHYPNFDFVVGSWGEGAEPKQRILVSMLYQPRREGGSFMVVDSESRPANDPELCGRAMKRAEVIGTPLANEIFQLVDAVWLQDSRVSEVAALDNEA
jgi:hypothetical protein